MLRPGATAQDEALHHQNNKISPGKASYVSQQQNVVLCINCSIRLEIQGSTLSLHFPQEKEAASILSVNAPKQDVHIQVSNPFNGCRNNECRPVGANWQSDSQDVQWWCKHASGCLFQAAYLLPSSICGTLAILTPGLTSIHPIHYLSLFCAGSQGGGASPS